MGQVDHQKIYLEKIAKDFAKTADLQQYYNHTATNNVSHFNIVICFLSFSPVCKPLRGDFTLLEFELKLYASNTWCIFQHKISFSCIFNFSRNATNKNMTTVRHHSFSTYAKFSQKHFSG